MYQILEKIWECSETVHQLFIDFKKSSDSVKREVLYNIMEFGVPMKLVRLIKIHLNETYAKVLVANFVSLVSCSKWSKRRRSFRAITFPKTRWK
jgi:hypothetical protein